VALSAVRLVHATFFQSIIVVLQIFGILSLVVIAERVAAKVRNDLFDRSRRTKVAEETPVAIEEPKT